MPEFEKLLKKLDDLTSSANTSCSEFTNILVALGFQIENCESAGHKIARHPFVKQHEEAIKEYLKLNSIRNFIQSRFVKKKLIVEFYMWVG